MSNKSSQNVGRNPVEALVGALVLLVAIGFVLYAYKTVNVKTDNGYNLVAAFDGVDGIEPGSDVRISGVKVGNVISIDLEPVTYLALVTINVGENIELTSDTVAAVTTEGLLGDRYMSLIPGSEETLLAPGDRIIYTQSSPGIEQLLGQVIYSLQNIGGE